MKKYPAMSVILVDDEAAFLSAASFALRREGITNVETFEDSRLVMDRLAKGGCGVLVLDMNMPHVTGRDILAEAAEKYPDVFILMLTAMNDVQSAVDCMKLGARDYILKPLQLNQLITTIRRAIDSRALICEAQTLKEYVLTSTLKHPEAFAPIITNNSAMRNIFRYAEAIAATDLPVLITGETGTGKELMAQALHTLSGRTGKFVCVNVAGVDEAVLNDSLFGHVRGAFTGAERDRKGFIEEAADGTLFCDEIGDLKPQSQVKLLRLLQEGTFHPLGSDTTVSSRARLVFATNRDLKGMLRSESFRHDLYYRLQAHEIRLPSLRERLDDIALIAAAFVNEAAEKLGKRSPHINPELFPLLSTYSWPGNIRELRGILYDAVTRNGTDTLSLAFLKEKIRELRGGRGVAENSNNALADAKVPLDKTVTFPASLPTAAEVERMLVREALCRTGGNKTLAAELLGMSRATLIKHSKEMEGSEK